MEQTKYITVIILNPWGVHFYKRVICMYYLCSSPLKQTTRCVVSYISHTYFIWRNLTTTSRVYSAHKNNCMVSMCPNKSLCLEGRFRWKHAKLSPNILCEKNSKTQPLANASYCFMTNNNCTYLII